MLFNDCSVPRVTRILTYYSQVPVFSLANNMPFVKPSTGMFYPTNESESFWWLGIYD